MKPVQLWRPPSRSSRPRRRAAAVVAGLAALTMAASTLTAIPGSPTQAAPADPAGPADPPAAASVDNAALPGSAAESHEVTLITGDQVELTRSSPDSPYEVEVTGAKRPAGANVTFMTKVGPDGVYVLPSDAVPAIRDGSLDRELFNVSYLAEQGLADTESGELPVIVSYPEPVGAAAHGYEPSTAVLADRADRLPAAAETVGLASVNGAGVTVAKERAGEFWQRLRGATDAGPRAASATPRVWLDRTAELALDESVPLVGAPAAWDAGYDGTGTTVGVLDTGVDLDHPDLAAQVVAAESFVDDLPPQDGSGHGTHVASTVAGTGGASGGQYTGVAPGADLFSGRVCNDGGSCAFSDMIAGMEWAARDMDADVVSMSLSGDPTDGTDPMSQAVNSLTASTGALFVISAGNAGGEQTVGSPGTADAALTVAATDKSDGLAGFSSRGPRFGDMALKPDIAAPGVDIVAARAAGTDLGTPVNESYTSLEGTSMAAPHVSGAAAILAQRHPDWSPEQLKAALMSTATDAGHTVYQQGAGRLDLARAATQQVHATSHHLDYGLTVIPEEGRPEPEPITKQVGYRNMSDQPVTLSLSWTLTTIGGDPVPADALSMPDTVTVPAQGTATAEATLDVAGIGRGRYTGAVVATDDATGTRLTTPVGLVREAPKVELAIHTLGRDGEPVRPSGTDVLDLTGPNGRITELTAVGDGTIVARVPDGTYSVAQLVSWVDEGSRFNSALLSTPEVVVDGDTEITLDARQANRIQFTTPRPSEPLNNYAHMAYQRTTPGGEQYASVVQHGQPYGSWARLWASPTDEVEVGAFRFWTQALLGKSEVAMSVTGPAARDLHPAAPLHHTLADGDPAEGGRQPAQDSHPGRVPFTGTQELPLVDVGTGSADDLAGRDLTGKLALLEVGTAFEGVFSPLCGVDVERLGNVRDAGAAGAVVFPSPEHDCPGPLGIPLPIVQEPLTGPAKEIGIPNVSLPTREALALRDRLADRPVTVRVAGTPETPYSYVLKPYEEGRVPESLHYTFTDADLAEVELDYHAPAPDTTFRENRTVWGPDDAVKQHLALSHQVAPAFTGARSRTEYFGPVSDQVLHDRIGVARVGGLDPEGYTNRMWRMQTDLFTQPDDAHDDWYVTPKTPGVHVDPDRVHELAGEEVGLDLGVCTFCRQAGILFGHFPFVTGAPGEARSDGGSGGLDDNSFEEGFFSLDISLSFEGDPVPSLPGLPWPLFTLPDEPGEYQLTAQGPRTDVTWTYTSGAPAEDTRRQGYGCFPELILGATGPCAPEPMVFASYDMSDSLASDNTVPAPGAHRFEVHAYHAPSAVPMPEIAGLDLWVSYDDGDNWTPARLRERADGSFQATVIHPPAHRRASDTVSLRVEAWDADGNRLEQVTRDAFDLRHRSRGPGPHPR